MFAQIPMLGVTTEKQQPKQEKTNAVVEEILQENAQNYNPYDITNIKKLVATKNHAIKEDVRINSIEEEIKKITSAITNEIEVPFDNVAYKKELTFLKSKINVNSRQDNMLAVQRDELKKEILINNKQFAVANKNIMNGINSYKDKKYFVSLLDKRIDSLKEFDLKKYRDTYKTVSANSDEVSNAYKIEYKKLRTQIKAQIFVYDYLKANMNQYRTSNLILDELSLKYIINKINSGPVISYITEVMHYYTNVTMGEIIVVLILIGLFMLFNKKIVPYLNIKLKHRLVKEYGKKGRNIYEYIYDSAAIPLSFILYIFAAQISVSLMIDNIFVLNKTTPWFNTAYLALFAYMLYAFLKNAIHFFADNLFAKYPNVRKEMIDFFLRIGKVFVFMFVLLFLFMQLGFDIQAILASLGIGGIAVALAAKDTLTNFFGSLSIITDNSFSQGDWIQAGDVEGTVVDIRMRTTRIRTFANGMITVPNGELSNASILNWSKRKIGRRIKMSLGITYSSDMKDIQALVKDIREMLYNHDGIATTKVQFDDKEKNSNLLKKEDLLGVKRTLLVFIDEFDSSSINILVYCFSRSPVWEEWLGVKEDVIVKINDLVQKNNCAFAFPTQSIFIEKDLDKE